MPPWSDRRGLRSVVLWVVLWVVPPSHAVGVSAARQRYNPPHDRFCQGREIGAACTALLTVDGTPVRDAGVCARITESAPRFYFRGWHIAQREVVNCVSPKPIERRYKEVSGWQKVRQ